MVAEIPTTLPPKAPRRSSLGIGLLVGGRGSGDSKYKRRSSIATAFLGRQNKVNFCFSYLLVHFSMIFAQYYFPIIIFPHFYVYFLQIIFLMFIIFYNFSQIICHPHVRPSPLSRTKMPHMKQLWRVKSVTPKSTPITLTAKQMVRANIVMILLTTI